MTPTLRRLLPEDVNPFRALRLKALRDHPKAYLQVHDEEIERPTAFHANMLANTITVGVVIDDQLAGYTILTPMIATKVKHKGHIWGAYVRPEFRDRDLAKQMREFLFEEARKIGLTICISSIVVSNKAAYAIHIALGYTETHREKDGIQHADGSFEDLVWLIKYL